MSAPLFTVVIPTLGRPTLERTLESIRSQAGPNWVEIIVVGDAYQRQLAGLSLLCHDYDARYYELDAGIHDTGSPQLHYGYMLATGAWVMNFGDDDVYEPGVFQMLSEIVIPDHTAIGPLMFRSEMHPGPQRGNTSPVVLWDRPVIERFHVTGQGFVTPNDKLRLGRWVDDVTFMRETVALWGGRIEWRDELIARCY